jgi:FtsZ-interacting cell division protein ZipA
MKVFQKIKDTVKVILSIIGIIAVFVLVIYAFIINRKKIKTNTDLLFEKVNNLKKKKGELVSDNKILENNLKDMEKKEKKIEKELKGLNDKKPKKVKKLSPEEMLNEFRDKEKKIFGN